MALSASLKRISFLAAVALSAVVIVDATQVMQRPGDFKTATLHKVDTDPKAESKIIHKRAGSKVQAAYFTNWCVASFCAISGATSRC